MSRFVIFFCMAALICGCTSKPTEKLADYPSVTKIFTEQEISDLQALLDSFEQEIGIQTDATPEAKVAGYSVFNKQVLASMEEGNLENYPLSNEQKIKLLDVLHVSTFRSIWSMGTGVRLIEDMKNRPHVSFNLGMSEKFEGLLSELGKEYPQFVEMHDDYKRAGAISPSFAKTLFLENDQLNLQDARVRLVYLICCLQGEWRKY